MSSTVRIGSWIFVGAVASIGAGVMAINTTSAVADTAYDNGFKAGSSDAKRMWDEVYHSQCARVNDFDTQATQGLIQGSYSGPGNYNQGGRDAVKKFIAWTHEQCPDVAMCESEGDGAALEVATRFCLFGGFGFPPVHHDVCIKIAEARCRDRVLGEIQSMATHHHCTSINNDINNVTESDDNWMMNACTDVVNNRIPAPPPAP